MKEKVDSYESFKKYQLPADSLEDFLERYTKPSAHRDRGEDHVKARIESHTKWLNKCGFTFITRHDSKTGEHISYYGNKEEL